MSGLLSGRRGVLNICTPWILTGLLLVFCSPLRLERRSRYIQAFLLDNHTIVDNMIRVTSTSVVELRQHLNRNVTLNRDIGYRIAILYKISREVEMMLL